MNMSPFYHKQRAILARKGKFPIRNLHFLSARFYYSTSLKLKQINYRRIFKLIFICFLLQILREKKRVLPVFLYFIGLVINFEGVVIVTTNKWHCFAQFCTNFFDFKIGCCITVSLHFRTSSFVVIDEVICKFT